MLHLLFHNRIHALLGSLLLLWTSLSPAALVVAQSTPMPDMEQLVQQLSARKFIQRETATLELIDRGLTVIPVIESNLANQNYEGIARSIHVLVQLSLQDKNQRFGSSNTARLALEKLAQSSNNRLARRADNALTRINEIREEEALARFRKLGGWVERVYTRIGADSKYVVRVYLNTSWQGSRDDLYLLSWIGRAQELMIEGIDLSDNWMPVIGKMRNLESLVLKRCKVQDADFAEVIHLKHLINLDIRYCPVTDTGLSHLNNMKQLLYVKLYGTQGTKESAEAIRIGAQADVDFRLGAFLGVGCRRPPAPCYIESVQEGTAAAKGGLMVGDIVTGFDDRDVTSFTDLRTIISEFSAGDKSVVRILRMGSPQTKTFTKQEDPTDLQVTLKEHIGGVLITDIKETSPLYDIGLRKNHVVGSMNLAEVQTPKQFLDQIALADKGPVRLVYYTKVKNMKVEVEFGEWE
ncbi:MAG: PDZ domain-containing protein [Planctomycetota bacterium]|nr:PDZ domain-containing protein [Planctomycetota bacterium]